MPTDRLFRQSISGTLFLLCTIIWYLIFGGTLDKITALIGGDKSLLPLIALFFSTPVIGLIVSTLNFAYMYQFHRRTVHYYVPKNKMIINYVFDQYPQLDKHISSRHPETWDIREVDTFYPFYQTQVRRFTKGNALEYLERRWAAYWTHCNTIGSICASFIAMIAYNIPLFIRCEPKFEDCQNLFYKIIGIVCLLGYGVLSYKHSKTAMRAGCDFEHAWLERKIKNKLKKK